LYPSGVELHFSFGEERFVRRFFPRNFSRSDPSVVYRVFVQDFVLDIAEIDGGIGTKPFFFVDPSFVFVFVFVCFFFVVIIVVVIIISLGCVDASTLWAWMSSYVSGVLQTMDGGRGTRRPECRAGRQDGGKDDYCGTHNIMTSNYCLPEEPKHGPMQADALRY
jgi:hypothetical protein